MNFREDDGGNMTTMRGLQPLWIFVCILFFNGSLFAAPPLPEKSLRATNGVLDLTGFDFARQGNLRLDGDWEFYWNELIPPADFTLHPEQTLPKKTGVFNVPRYWDGTAVNGKKLQGDGFATFRLTVLLPENYRQDHVRFGLKLPDFATAFQLWIDGKDAASAGVVTRELPKIVPNLNKKREIYFVNIDRKFEIVLQVANSKLISGGPGESIWLGLEEPIKSAAFKRHGTDSFISGGLFLIFIYHIFLFLLRKKDPSLLLFGLFSLLILIRCLITGDRMIISLLPDFPWDWIVKLEFLTFYFVPVILVKFLYTLFQKEYRLLLVRLVSLISLLLIGIVILTPPKVFALTLIPFDIFTLILGCYCLYKLIISLIQKRESALFILLEFVFLFIISINDILYFKQIINTGSFLTLGIILVLISQMFYHSFRFSNALDSVENLSIDLEHKVEDRTRKLDDANQKLMELDELKNDFIANISHDFRSPLTVILNISDLALQSNAVLPPRVKEDFQVINKASFRLKSSIDKLLDLAKLDAQGIRVCVSRLKLVAFINSILDFYRSSLMKSGIRLVAKLPDHEPENFFSDPEKLEEIIDNILSNAIKFVDRDRGVITLELLDLEDTVRIIISDNGPGIPADKLESIFNRFEQAHKNMAGVYKGTGIGLAFSRQLANYLKGSIRAQSEGEGKGASFILDFRKGIDAYNVTDFASSDSKGATQKNLKTLIDIDLESKMQEKGVTSSIFELNAEGRYDIHKALILIIDDDRNVRNIVSRYLKKHGYLNFLEANDGEEGLEAVYQFHPDIIISDFNMPHMSGDQFHDTLISNPSFSKIPFIFLSAVVDHNLITERREKGACAYLQKPIDEKDLALTVNQFLTNYFNFLKVFNLATIDQLSGLYNRREVMRRFDQELAVRHFRKLSVILFDIDDFKHINDDFGHQCGDLAISSIGELVLNKMRKSDICGRYGGDEFLIILPDTDLQQARVAADELRLKIAETRLICGNHDFRLTVSMGGASLWDNAATIETKLEIPSLRSVFEIGDSEAADWDQVDADKKKIAGILFALADTALYQAKRHVCLACGYSTHDQKRLLDGKCPECGGQRLQKGKNRVETYVEKTTEVKS